MVSPLTRLVLAKDPEDLLEVVLLVALVELLVHHHAELGELEVAAAVHVHLVDHVLPLGLRRVLARPPHRRVQLLRTR